MLRAWIGSTTVDFQQIVFHLWTHYIQMVCVSAGCAVVCHRAATVKLTGEVINSLENMVQVHSCGALKQAKSLCLFAQREIHVTSLIGEKKLDYLRTNACWHSTLHETLY